MHNANKHPPYTVHSAQPFCRTNCNKSTIHSIFGCHTMPCTEDSIVRFIQCLAQKIIMSDDVRVHCHLIRLYLKQNESTNMNSIQRTQKWWEKFTEMAQMNLPAIDDMQFGSIQHVITWNEINVNGLSLATCQSVKCTMYTICWTAYLCNSNLNLSWQFSNDSSHCVCTSGEWMPFAPENI